MVYTFTIEQYFRFQAVHLRKYMAIFFSGNFYVGFHFKAKCPILGKLINLIKNSFVSYFEVLLKTRLAPVFQRLCDQFSFCNVETGNCGKT
jgi:hypothetical protein